LTGKLEELRTTKEHPFWLKDTGWMAAGNLLQEDQVADGHGGWLRVHSSIWEQDRAEVFNLAVANTRTYFVGENAAWVHNNDCAAGAAAAGGCDEGDRVCLTMLLRRRIRGCVRVVATTRTDHPPNDPSHTTPRALDLRERLDSAADEGLSRRRLDNCAFRRFVDDVKALVALIGRDLDLRPSGSVLKARSPPSTPIPEKAAVSLALVQRGMRERDRHDDDAFRPRSPA
jgi:hypothetical protein